MEDHLGREIVPSTDGAEDPSSPAIQHNFEFGVYTISASLAYGGYQYDYTEGDHDDYIIEIHSPNFQSEVADIAGLLGVDLSQTSLSAPGDINNDGQINLEDKILALKIITALQDAEYSDPTDDADGDGKIGIEEALFWKE